MVCHSLSGARGRLLCKYQQLLRLEGSPSILGPLFIVCLHRGPLVELGGWHIFPDQIISYGSLFYTYNNFWIANTVIDVYKLKFDFVFTLFLHFLCYIIANVKSCLYAESEFRDSINKLFLPTED